MTAMRNGGSTSLFSFAKNVKAALWRFFPDENSTSNPSRLKRKHMIPDDLLKIKRYFHHKEFDKSHHDHTQHAQTGVSTQKSGTREIKVVRRVLDVNAKMAEQNRRLFADKGIFVLNVMSSPGSGKTTTLEKTLTRIMPEIKSAVIVGDICTTHDADRLANTEAPVVQINTDEFGGDCHLVAHVIEKAAVTLDLTISNFWSLKTWAIWSVRLNLISVRIHAL
jgi:G3E family GTPase